MALDHCERRSRTTNANDDDSHLSDTEIAEIEDFANREALVSA